MLNSSISIIEGIAVIELDLFDLDSAAFGLHFTEEMRVRKIHRVVINMEAITICSSSDLKRLAGLLQIFKLNGIDAVVSNMRPELAACIASLPDVFSGQVYLNVGRALDALGS